MRFTPLRSEHKAMGHETILYWIEWRGVPMMLPKGTTFDRTEVLLLRQQLPALHNVLVAKFAPSIEPLMYRIWTEFVDKNDWLQGGNRPEGDFEMVFSLAKDNPPSIIRIKVPQLRKASIKLFGN